VAPSARRVTLHLPESWPWRNGGTPVRPTPIRPARPFLTTKPTTAPKGTPAWNTPTARSALTHAHARPSIADADQADRSRFGSSGVVVAPTAILGISAGGLIDVATALRAISATLAVPLIIVTLLAVRRLRVGPWRRALALAMTAALGLAALGIELAVHQ